jgi:hypothetical protein
MAIEVDIQVRNGILKITVGASQTKTGNATGPAVIGPIVVDGSGMQGHSGQGIFGGAGPAGPSGSVGGAGPAGPSGSVGGAGPAGPSGSVGGGPGSGGSGSNCPVIIGPIVISGCSGQAGVDPPAASDPQVIATCPPTGIAIGPRAAAFVMQTQRETDWCWAAVAVSMNAFLDPQPLDAVPTWTQPSLATQVLAQEFQWNPPVDCSADPTQTCDRPAGLDDALGVTGNLRQAGAMFDQILDFASIQCWIDQQLPVGARIVWPYGGAHFVALSGYQVFASGEQKVLVQDPLYGSSLQDYSSLRGHYIYNGSWNDTYLVTP